MVLINRMMASQHFFYKKNNRLGLLSLSYLHDDVFLNSSKDFIQ
jgi:hypothetical protein